MANRRMLMCASTAAVVAAAAFAVILGIGLLPRPYYVLRVGDAHGIQVGDPVELSGVPIGAVSRVDASSDGALVRFQLVQRHRRLTTTAHVRISRPLLAARAKILVTEPCGEERAGPPLQLGMQILEAGVLSALQARLLCR